MKYLKLKIEDAVNATKAAIEEGIVAGGGSALIRRRQKSEENTEVRRYVFCQRVCSRREHPTFRA